MPNLNQSGPYNGGPQPELIAYGFEPGPHRFTRGSIPQAKLRLTTEKLPGPFVVDPDRGIFISTWECDGICRYIGIDTDDYLRIAGLIALTQWRALQENPLLRIEDLRHPPDVRCLFAPAASVQDFALLLDPPALCNGCQDFYHCLGADTELLALRRTLTEVLPPQSESTPRCLIPANRAPR